MKKGTIITLVALGGAGVAILLLSRRKAYAQEPAPSLLESAQDILATTPAQLKREIPVGTATVQTALLTSGQASRAEAEALALASEVEVRPPQASRQQEVWSYWSDTSRFLWFSNPVPATGTEALSESIQAGIGRWFQLSADERRQAMRDWYAIYQADHRAGTASRYTHPIASNPSRFRTYRAFTGVTTSGLPWPITFWTFIAYWQPVGAQAATTTTAKTATLGLLDQLGFLDETSEQPAKFAAPAYWQPTSKTMGRHYIARPGLLLRRP